MICSEDTDVFIVSLALHDKIGASLFQKCGTKARRRVVDITKVAATVGIDVCRALVGVHAYTGCDTVSAFAGKGKAKALKLLSKNKEIQDTFFKLGQEWDLSPDLMNKQEAYTSLLYAPKTSSTKINDLRYHMFCVKKGEIESHQLPLEYGEYVWSRILKYQARLAEDGRSRRKELTISWYCIGWMSSQHHKLSWIYWPATVQGSVNFQGVNVWQMGSSVLICADCQTVRTRPKP